MTKKEKDCTQDTKGEQEAEEVVEQHEEAAAEAAAEPETSLEQQIKELEEKLLRLHADFDNFRKRTVRERSEQAIWAEATVVSRLLPVLDNFDRALANLPEETVPWIEGVQLVHKQLLDTLCQLGMEIIDCEQPFDPNVHEAVMRETCGPDVEDGTILQELQKGYLYKGKLLRPSRVKVASRG